MFTNYINKYYVETGSYTGNTIQKALDAGFKNVISFEITQKYYDICKERFKNNKNVKLILGDSYQLMFDSIKKINTPITFFLDAHLCDNDTDYSTVAGKCPLLYELDQIKKHSLKNHTILIDDVRLCRPEHFGITLDDIKNKILSINSKYVFTFEDYYYEKDVLVARIE